MEPGIKQTITFILIALAILLAGLTTAFVMNEYFCKKQIFIDNGPQYDNATRKELNGTWSVLELGDGNKILSKYDVSVNEYNKTVYFVKDTVTIGQGLHYNQTIQTETFQGWSKFGNMLISIVNGTEMRGLPETTAAKWILFTKR
jgi:hypothetical protein